MNARRLVAFYCCALLAVVSFFNSCEAYRPNSTQKTSTMGNPNRSDDTVFAVAKYGQISSLAICLKQLTFVNADGAIVTLPYAPLKEMAIPDSGIELGSLPLPPGQYKSIALEIADECGTGHSIVLKNEQGTFTSTNALQLKFSGNEFAGSGVKKIVFDLQAIASNLSEVTSNSNLPAAAATVGGYHSVGCGIQSSPGSVAFCDTFDKPSTSTSRASQLDGSMWNVTRFGPSNQGQGEFSIWNSSTIDACGTLQQVQAGRDIVICDGQLRESVNDGDAIRALTMSPNQAFDFSGRTGTVAFDITNDTSGTTGVYPEILLTDEPSSRPRHGISLQLSGNIRPNEGAFAPGCVNDQHARWIVGSIQIIQNYVSTEIPWTIDNKFKLQTLGCVIASDGPHGKMNHIELKISQNQIEVWASDAGNPILKRIAIVENLTLPFSKGYLSFVDRHNHASAGPRPETANHTFAWDNVAFDGPVVPRDLNLNVPESLDPVRPGVFNLGWQSYPQTPVQLTTATMSATDLAQAANSNPVLVFDFELQFANVTAFEYSINGVRFIAPPPFVPQLFKTHTIALPVPASALVAGPQQISIWANEILILSNVDIRVPGAL